MELIDFKFCRYFGGLGNGREVLVRNYEVTGGENGVMGEFSYGYRVMGI